MNTANNELNSLIQKLKYSTAMTSYLMKRFDDLGLSKELIKKSLEICFEIQKEHKDFTLRSIYTEKKEAVKHIKKSLNNLKAYIDQHEMMTNVFNLGEPSKIISEYENTKLSPDAKQRIVNAMQKDKAFRNTAFGNSFEPMIKRLQASIVSELNNISNLEGVVEKEYSNYDLSTVESNQGVRKDTELAAYLKNDVISMLPEVSNIVTGDRTCLIAELCIATLPLNGLTIVETEFEGEKHLIDKFKNMTNKDKYEEIRQMISGSSYKLNLKNRMNIHIQKVCKHLSVPSYTGNVKIIEIKSSND